MQYGSRQQFDTANVGNTRMSTSPLSGGGFSDGGGGIITVLEPFGEYLTDQIDTQRVDPFLEMVSNAAYQEFGIQPDQGGGSGFFSGDFYKNTGGFDPLPEPLPAVQQPVMNPNSPSSPVASMSNFGPDVGNGGLFGNDGFGSVSQGPLDFPTAQIPKYEKGFDDGGISNEPMTFTNGFSGPPMQMPYDPTPMSPLLMDSFAAAGGTLPDFSGSAQGYFGPSDPRGPVTPMTPEDILRAAQNRNMQQDLKPKEVQAYLDHVIKTGGRPTMMAPPTNYSNLAGDLLSAGPQPLTPMSGPMNLVDQYGNPASFSPAQLEEMSAATPISSFLQQDLSRPAPRPATLASGTTISPTGQLLHSGPLR